MKYSLDRVAVLVALLSGPAVLGGFAQAGVVNLSAQSVAVGNLRTITLHVPGMSCRMCANPIAHHLRELGVQDISVDLKTKRVTGRFHPERLTQDAIRTRVERLGFRVASVRVE